MDQKMMKTLGMVIAGFVVFILILFLIASCSKSNYTYEKLEEKMMKVAKEYYTNNEKELPSQDKDTSTYTLKKMISDEKIDELSELFDDENVKCDGNVTVTNNNGYYVYSPYLSCGKDYETVYLKDKIVEDSLVETGIGLYESGDEYIFKGEVTNNYVKFNEKTFRIIRINDDGSIRLMELNGLSQKMWDNRYNEDANYNSGRNDYLVGDNIDSRLKEAIGEYYNNSEVWDDEAKGYITTQSLCIGKRSKSDMTKDGSTECSVKLDNQTFGAITIYEYLQASLDQDCTSTSDRSCRNYNWFGSLNFTTWTLTADVETSNYAYSLNKRPSSTICNTRAYVNVVFNLTDKAVYVSGNGTEEDPYIFK